MDALSRRKAVGLDHTGRPRDRELRRRRNAGSRQHVLGEGLGALDRRRRRARPEDRDACRPQHVGDSGDERRLGPDHHEVDVERMREREQPLRVLGADRMALGEPRDARASRGGMEIGQGRCLRELPGERVLAPARTDQESTHRTSLVRLEVTSVGVGFRPWITPTSNSGSTPTSRRGEPTTRRRSASSSARTPATGTTRGTRTTTSRDAPRSSPSWLEERDEPGSWTAEYRPWAIDGERAVAIGVSRYLAADGETVEREYHNVFLCRFDDAGRCSEFTELFMRRNA